MEVAVAVVSWNTRELLRGCLHSLEPEAASGRAEVWVCDNASEDGSAEMVATSFPWVRLIASERNLGFGPAVTKVARRSGASPASPSFSAASASFSAASASASASSSAGSAAPGPAPTPWIAAANADIVLTPGALETLLAAGGADAGAGIVAPQLILPDASIQHSVHPFPGLGATLAFNLGLGGLSPQLAQRLTLDGHWDRGVPRMVDWAHGAFLLIRRAAFDAVGGFDPGQFLYAEDLDIAWRMRQAGWHTRYEPAAVVDHAHSAAITQLYGDDRDFLAQRSAYAWMLRRQGPLLMRTCALLNTLGAGARAIAATSRAAVGADGDDRLNAWRLRRHTQIHLRGLTTSRRALEQHR